MNNKLSALPDEFCEIIDDLKLFDFSNNNICPPYPDCINTEGFWDQNTEVCEEMDQIGDLQNFRIVIQRQ